MGRAAPLGIGGVLILVVLSLVTGQDFTEFLEPGADGPVAPPGATAPSDQPLATTPAEEKLVEFVSFVLDDAQDTWTKLLGPQYQRAKLVTFRDSTESACGLGRAATGPFYCPGDRKIYIDLGFYQELRDRFGAPGEFAQAYVLAHEIGHHVQTLTGIEPKVRRLQEANPERGNELSVRLELQADCYAGVWGHSTNERQLLESGEIDAGLAAAAAIGDDRLQRMGGGRVSPEKFTHGSSGQRVEWFKRGLQSGEPSACETFGR
jgi:predicted metalloprotease